MKRIAVCNCFDDGGAAQKRLRTIVLHRQRKEKGGRSGKKISHFAGSLEQDIDFKGYNAQSQ